jgi:hypothetical protein
MSRRLDIKITSVNGATATWRAAGAKQPKGVLDVTLLGDGFVVGATYRAEIEQYMEGVEVLSVTPPKTASPLDPRHERLALVTPEPKGPDVQVTYAPKGRGRRDDDRGERGGRVERRDRGARPTRPARPDRAATAERSERPARAERPNGERAPRERRTGEGALRGPRTVGGERRGSRPGQGPRPAGPPQPPVTTTHRNAFLATLSAEQLPVAEQLLRGGMPAVRKAVEEQNRNAESQGRPTISAEAIDRIAEELLGRANLAFWKDRAGGAIAAGKELRLRDLRAVVTSAKTVTLDDDARSQLKELQASLTARITALRDEWNAKMERALANDDVLESLRLTVRTPEPTTRVSAEAAAKITAITSAALTAETPAELWQEIVNAAVESPVRRLIKPIGIPSDPACHALAVKSAGSIPEFAKLLGMKVPPPPPPTRPARRPATTRRS